MLTEPVEPDSQAGVLFMHNHGFSMMCGHGVIGVLTIAIERGLLQVSDESAIRLDTPAGTICASLRVMASTSGRFRSSACLRSG